MTTSVLLQFLCYSLALLLLVFAFALYARKFSNPYKLIMIFGKKGCGKTTFITKWAWIYCNKGYPVYVDAPVQFEHENLHLFDSKQLGKKVFPPESIVFIDEAGILFDNRKYKNLPDEVRDYFKFQRHYRNTVYLFSQDFDIDVKLRKLTDYMYLLTGHMNVFSIGRRIRRTITIVSSTAEAESRIADNLEFVPVWMQLFGVKALMFTFVPKWVKKFDSYVIDENLPYFE